MGQILEYFEGRTNRICDELYMRSVSKRGSKDDTRVWRSNWKTGIAIYKYDSIHIKVHVCASLGISTEKCVKNDSGLSQSSGISCDFSVLHMVFCILRNNVYTYLKLLKDKALFIVEKPTITKKE